MKNYTCSPVPCVLTLHLLWLFFQVLAWYFPCSHITNFSGFSNSFFAVRRTPSWVICIRPIAEKLPNIWCLLFIIFYVSLSSPLYSISYKYSSEIYFACSFFSICFLVALNTISLPFSYIYRYCLFLLFLFFYHGFLTLDLAVSNFIFRLIYRIFVKWLTERRLLTILGTMFSLT